MEYTIKSNGRGHEVGYKNEKWFYCDNNEIYDDSRACKKCGLFATAEGHDPCIANLIGVTDACCGHGVSEAYVALESGLVIRGKFDHLRMSK